MTVLESVFEPDMQAASPMLDASVTQKITRAVALDRMFMSASEPIC